MKSALSALYPHSPECFISLCDLTHPGAEEHLWREYAAWHGYAYVENLEGGMRSWRGTVPCLPISPGVAHHLRRPPTRLRALAGLPGGLFLFYPRS